MRDPIDIIDISTQLDVTERGCLEAIEMAVVLGRVCPRVMKVCHYAVKELFKIEETKRSNQKLKKTNWNR